MNYQKHCLVTSKNQRKTFSQQVPKWDIEGVQSFNNFIEKLFRKKISNQFKRKANQNEKLKIISYSQRIKKEKEPLISQQTSKT